MNEPQNNGESNAASTKPNPSLGVETPIKQQIEPEHPAANPDTTPDRHHTNPIQWLSDLWRENPDRVIELALAGAIVIFSGCQIAITLINNASTSTQVDKIIAAARGIEDSAAQMKNAAWDFKGSAQGIDGNFGNAVAKLQSQVEKMDAAHALSEQQSQQSLKATIENFHLEQRAWVGFSGFVVQPDTLNPNAMKIGNTPISMNVAVSYIVNSGRTPARDTEGIAGLAFVDSAHIMDKEDERWMQQVVNDIRDKKIEPNSFILEHAHAVQYDASSPSFGNISFKVFSLGSIPTGIPVKFTHPTNWLTFDPQKLVVVFGELTYFDIYSRRPRTTSFCAYRPKTIQSELTACPIFNEMN